MEEREATRIGATEVDINTLFGHYLIWTEDDSLTLDDFYLFIQQPNVDRDIFLNEYCDYEYKEVGESTLIRFKVKQ